MNKIRIITDSGSDINPNNQLNITVLPMTIRFGNEEYYDGINLTTSEFYEKLIESDELPTTSLVSPIAFEEAYKTAKENGEDVLVITISSKLSGTYQSAVLASEEYDNVYIVDSKSVTIGENILISYALELIENGLNIKEIVKKLEEKREKIHLMALLDTLEYLKKGGRISSTVAFVGGALSIKPVVAVKDGEVSMIGKARGSRNGNNHLIKEIENSSGIDFSKPIRLGYTGLNDDMLKKYIEDSSHLLKDYKESLQISHIGPTIGTHVGPGAIAVAFFSK